MSDDVERWSFDLPDGRHVEGVMDRSERYRLDLRLPAGLQDVAGLARQIVAESTKRIGELAGSHGCEAAAEVARMEGRAEAARLILKAVESS